MVSYLYGRVRVRWLLPFEADQTRDRPTGAGKCAGARIQCGHRRSISGFNRFTAAAKSPLTGAYGESEAGGYFGPEMKFAGFDAMVIYGKAPKPSYLYVHDGEVELRDAKSVWGLNNWETLLKIQEELGDKRIRVGP